MPTIPTDVQPRSLARILVAPSFGGGAGPWEILPMRAPNRPGGYEFIDCDRVPLPGVGQAHFTALYGIIDGVAVAAEITEGSIAGEAWSPDSSTAGARDLIGYEVRIQVAPYAAPGTEPAWKTKWWGEVSLQEDSDWPGAPYPAGVRTYHCVDGFARARRWPLHRHSVYSDSRIYVGVAGAMGYNVGADGKTIGNRSTVTANSGTSAQREAAGLPDDTDGLYFCHAPQAVEESWTDQQVIENACRISRAQGDPLFTIIGNGAGDATDPLRLLSEQVLAWPFAEGDTAWDLAARICRRERGRGLVWVDWADDSGDPTGPLSVRLKIFAQTRQSVTWVNPTTGGTLNLPGADAAGTTVAVDLIGDHRLEAGDFRIADAGAQRVDAVETVGERIQVLATVSAYGDEPSWAKTWDEAYEATIAALDPEVRAAERYHGFWTLGRLPLDWRGALTDHNGGAIQFNDYRCSDAGGIAVSDTEISYTSPLDVRLLSDLPLYDGYDYTTSAFIRFGGVTDPGEPQRRPPFVVMRVGDGAYLAGDDLSPPLSMRVGEYQAQAFASSDLAAGSRVIAGNTTPSVDWDATYAWSDLGLTIGLEMPHRVRMRTVRNNASGPVIVRQTQRIEVPGMHLWLAAPSAIWDLDRATEVGDGYAPKRGAAGGVGVIPGYLRDDRNALARIHALACSWYLSTRKTASWSLYCCGLLPNFEAVTDPETGATTTIAYPTIGQVVTTIRAAGQLRTIDTPISRIYYRHDRQMTTWETSWPELDFR